MKILMVGWEFPPFRSGGLGTHCYHITKNLASLGHDLVFLMPKNPFKIDCGYMKIIEIEPGMKFGPYVPKDLIGENYSGDLFDDVWRYNKTCADYAIQEDFELIHCHDWITSIAGLEIKRRTGKPMVVTIHSTEYNRTGNLSPNEWILQRERDVIKGADLVITVSGYMKQHIIEKFGTDPDKIVVIYNAIDHESWAVDRIRELYPNEKIVLFFGRLTLQKGPDFFLKAAKKVLEKNPNTRFLIGGKGDMLPQLIQEVIDLGISDRVMFLGYVLDEEVAALYSAADVFVLSSVSEPFGITVLESIAAGTPTIITKQSGVSEVVKNSFTVDFWDVDEMANKILALISYPALNKTMRREGKNEIKDYTWRKVARQTVDEAYKRVLGRS